MYTSPVKKEDILKAIAEEFDTVKELYFESTESADGDLYHYYMGCYDGIMNILKRVPIYEK